jgi:hypothetical protein
VALLVSCIAAIAIVIASGVIYLLDSPRGDERRELIQRVLSSFLDDPSNPSEPP